MAAVTIARPDAGSPKEPAGEHERDLIILDIQAYNAADRSDSDRSAVRGDLQAAVQTILSDLGVELPAKSEIDFAETNDTGDGLVIVLPHSFEPAVLLTGFFPRVTEWLQARSQTAPQSQRIKLRAAIGRGSVIVDAPAITRRGVVGKAINEAARLVDCDQLRNELARQPRRRIALIATGLWLDRLASTNTLLSANFRRVATVLKDGTYVGHIYLFDAKSKLHPHPTENNRAAGTASPTQTLEDLPPHVYLSVFDYHIGRSYGGNAQTHLPLREQLATGLLLYEGVLIHCADPYRSAPVREILDEFSEFISEGRIKFVLSNAIGDNLESDYRAYLVGRVAAYAESRYGELDVASLEQSVQTDPNALAHSIALLGRVPTPLKRGFSGTATFRGLLINDLSAGEQIISNTWPLGKLSHNNYTISQLVNMKRVDRSKTPQSLVSNSTASKFFELVEDLIAGDNFSRQTIVTLLDEQFGSRDKLRPLRYMLEARLNLLFIQSCCRPHQHSEVTRARDERSPVYHAALFRHLVVVSGFPKSVNALSAAQVRSLVETRGWRSFVAHHLRCMAEVIGSRMADSGGTSMEAVFRSFLPILDDQIDRNEIRRILGDVSE